MPLRFDAGRPALHKAIYILCLPALLGIGNALVYYLLKGRMVVPWALIDPSDWDELTFFAPMVLIPIELVATILFFIFALSRKVSRTSKVVAALAVASAWILTMCSSFVIDYQSHL